MSNIILNLKDKIKAEIAEANDFDAEHIKDYPTVDFKSYPAACVRTDEGTAEYETTSENYEEYIFTIFFLHLTRTGSDEQEDPAKSRRVIEEIVGAQRLHFDQDEFMSGLTLPSGHAFLGVRPISWRIFDEESGKYVVGELRLACRVSKSI